MSSNYTGGPAFPVECDWPRDGGEPVGMQTGNRTGWTTGMTMRDYFARAAMQSLIGDMVFMKEARFKGLNVMDAIAGAAYMQADAMLKARQA